MVDVKSQIFLALKKFYSKNFTCEAAFADDAIAAAAACEEKYAAKLQAWLDSSFENHT